MSTFGTIFKIADFRRLFAGVTTSQLGDQFALIATPWLVLQLTGDPLALGLVLALEGGPRALFMLIGGAITDRFSPRKIMLVSDAIRFVLAGLLAFAILSHQIDMWMVYSFALGLGIVAGFAVPAGNSIVPMVIDEKDLQTGNATVMGGGQIMGFVGPVLAGILIGHSTDSLTGVGVAFAIDAITYAFSALMLWQMRRGADVLADDENRVLTSVLIGLKYTWDNKPMRVTFLIIAAINLLFVGPVMVGIPVLAETRLPEGARAFGLLIAGFAGGNLGGYILAGVLPTAGRRVMRTIPTILLFGIALVLAVMGTIGTTWTDFGLLVGLGIGNGYVTIVLISAIQTRTPKDMLGRIMGLFMLSSMGLVPISQAISGVISRWDVSLLFLCAAGLMTLVAAWVTVQPTLSSITEG